MWVDFDGDGDLDLFVAFRERANALFRNDGGRFTDVAGALGLADTRKSVGAVWFDFDRDGRLDLYVANMDGEPNGLFANRGDSFEDAAGAAGLRWGGRTPDEPSHGTVRPCAADVNTPKRDEVLLSSTPASSRAAARKIRGSAASIGRQAGRHARAARHALGPASGLLPTGSSARRS